MRTLYTKSLNVTGSEFSRFSLEVPSSLVMLVPCVSKRIWIGFLTERTIFWLLINKTSTATVFTRKALLSTFCQILLCRYLVYIYIYLIFFRIWIYFEFLRPLTMGESLISTAELLSLPKPEHIPNVLKSRKKIRCCLRSLWSLSMAKHHPDLIFCRKQPGVGETFQYNLCRMRKRRKTIIVWAIIQGR